MFTGLIEAVCTVSSAHRDSSVMRLTVDLGKLTDEVEIGDSIAVSGACLTVAKLNGSLASFDISAETLAKSTLAKCTSASKVNIEPALKATSRFGGHFVTGHIDGVAKIKKIEKQDKFANIRFETSPELLEQMVVKGSIAVDGISLTIAALDQNSFSVAVIPQTLEKTTLATAKIGDTVNLETDMIVKVIKKHLEKVLPQKQDLTVQNLKNMGF